MCQCHRRKEELGSEFLNGVQENNIHKKHVEMNINTIYSCVRTEIEELDRWN